jgi:arginase family enzyme
VFQAGMHGPLYVADDEGLPAELGTEMVPWLELCELTPAAFAERVRRRVGIGPTFLTFDVDLVDACFCPGTGTPEVGGPTPHQALQYVRALAGIPFVGFDVVEVSPPYDGPAQVTSLFAANLLFDLLALVARDRLARGDGAAAGARDRAQ